MGSREKEVPGRGNRQASVDGGPVPARDPSPVPNPMESLTLEEPLSEQKPSVTAFVDGKRVKALYVNMRYPAFLITEDMGTHDATRIYVMLDGKAKCGDRMDCKVGPGVVTNVSFQRGVGLTVETTRGNLWSPAQDCTCTWVP